VTTHQIVIDVIGNNHSFSCAKWEWNPFITIITHSNNSHKVMKSQLDLLIHFFFTSFTHSCEMKNEIKLWHSVIPHFSITFHAKTESLYEKLKWKFFLRCYSHALVHTHTLNKHGERKIVRKMRCKKREMKKFNWEIFLCTRGFKKIKILCVCVDK
jgi:hypothetical protein